MNVSKRISIKNGPVQAVEFPSEYLPDTHATGDVLADAQLEPAGQSVTNEEKVRDARCIQYVRNKSNKIRIRNEKWEKTDLCMR